MSMSSLFNVYNHCTKYFFLLDSRRVPALYKGRMHRWFNLDRGST